MPKPSGCDMPRLIQNAKDAVDAIFTADVSYETSIDGMQEVCSHIKVNIDALREDIKARAATEEE